MLSRDRNTVMNRAISVRRRHVLVRLAQGKLGRGSRVAAAVHQRVGIRERRHAPEMRPGLRAILIEDAAAGAERAELPSWTLFCNQLTAAIRRARSVEREPFAVMVLDLDRFRTVNASLGHAVGDRLLVAVAQRLATTISRRDTLTHLGGDEFALLVDRCGNPGSAHLVASRIHAALRRPFHVDGNEAFVSVSIGIALCSTGLESPEDYLRGADTAMYRAKAAGHGG